MLDSLLHFHCTLSKVLMIQHIHTYRSRMGAVVLRRLKVETSQIKNQLKAAVVQAWKSITKDKCNSLVMLLGQWIDAVIANKRYATKYCWFFLFLFFTFIYFKAIWSNTSAHLKIDGLPANVPCPKLLNTCTCKYWEMKADCLIFIFFISNPNDFSV